MPYKYKDPYRHKFEAAKYKVTNWHEYNQALIERGNITIWFNEKAIKSWYAKSNGKSCGQRLYSNLAIETSNIIRLVFHLPYRQTQGFMLSIIELMGITLKIPNFSTLSRRLNKIPTRLLSKKTHKNGTHIIIDGSGLSVYGADEFYVINDVLTKVRGYRRLNVAINEHQEIVACELTTLHKSEAKQVPKLLQKIKDHSKFIIADKNYDDKYVYAAIKKYRPTQFIRPVAKDEYHIIIPPQSNAIIRQQNGKYPLERSNHIKMIQDHGVIQWQKSTGYGVRSLVETAFSRYKRIIGQFMHTTTLANQKSEAKLACKVLNIMTALGMPKTERVT